MSIGTRPVPRGDRSMDPEENLASVDSAPSFCGAQAGGAACSLVTGRPSGARNGQPTPRASRVAQNKVDADLET
jgi:hypothetical protein